MQVVDEFGRRRHHQEIPLERNGENENGNVNVNVDMRMWR
jgi:hypothetical protein